MVRNLYHSCRKAKLDHKKHFHRMVARARFERDENKQKGFQLVKHLKFWTFSISVKPFLGIKICKCDEIN